MPYKCTFRCTSYNPSCDACDSSTTSDNPYLKDEDDILFKAAKRGQNKQEYLEDEDEDND